MIDQDGNEIPMKTKEKSFIEIILPRDPNLVIPPMIQQNVTSISLNEFFYIQSIDLNSDYPNIISFSNAFIQRKSCLFIHC